VFDARGELAAIMGLQGPSSRFVREAMRAGLEALLVEADAVSRALGRSADSDLDA
jgi:DNA-binding IclR family transcriptional regulator